MSFITSSTTVTITTYLTSKGRNFLVSGTKKDIEITQYVLGDSDTNYNQVSQAIPLPLTSGNVPDITGDNTDCVKSVSDDVDIKHKIRVKPRIK
ncbi:hypothetical protein COB55_05100 [Candidatus Wolfebacteria bacterium]|nr:MAG: hypothetical protein COB55_05100 [Candidatus Wolfebacteria bacterium]